MNLPHRRHLLAMGILMLGCLSSTRADTSEAIQHDFEHQANREIAELHRTLEKAAGPIIAHHLQTGKTAEAKALLEQVRQKLAGETGVTPAPELAPLFARHDAARDQKLQPLRAAALRRIDTLLRGNAGKNLETLDQLARLRTLIEGKASVASSPGAVAIWTYHNTATSTVVMAEIRLHPDGLFEMSTIPEKGRWKARSDRIDIDIRDQRWRMEIQGDVATLQRPDIGTRWLRKKAP
jgi:type IV pilus biogenesis protein CpaD/CtpE